MVVDKDNSALKGKCMLLERRPNPCRAVLERIGPGSGESSYSTVHSVGDFIGEEASGGDDSRVCWNAHAAVRDESTLCRGMLVYGSVLP